MKDTLWAPRGDGGGTRSRSAVAARSPPLLLVSALRAEVLLI